MGEGSVEKSIPRPYWGSPRIDEERRWVDFLAVAIRRPLGVDPAMLAMTGWLSGGVGVFFDALTRCDLIDGGRCFGPLPWSVLIIGRIVLYGRG